MSAKQNKKKKKGAKAPEDDVIALPKKVYNADWKDDVAVSEPAIKDELGYETFKDEAKYESPKDVSEEALEKQLEWAKKQKIGRTTLSVVSLLERIGM